MNLIGSSSSSSSFPVSILYRDFMAFNKDVSQNPFTPSIKAYFTTSAVVRATQVNLAGLPHYVVAVTTLGAASPLGLFTNKVTH